MGSGPPALPNVNFLGVNDLFFRKFFSARLLLSMFGLDPPTGPASHVSLIFVGSVGINKVKQIE